MAVNKKDLTPMTFPRVPPDKGVGDYMRSKLEDETIKKFPEWDVPRNEPDAEIVAVDRELYSIEGKLAEKRIAAEKQREEMDAQWKDIAEKEAVFKESFIKFNKFVKGNQEKRDRAERKTAEETIIEMKRDVEIEDLMEKYEHMSDVKSRMEYQIKRHRLYEDYLQEVFKTSGAFKSINGILNRYEALAEARNDLAIRQEEDLTALEEAQNQMVKLMEEKTLTLMGLNNKVANLQSRYVIAKNKALQWEATVTKIKNTAIERMEEIHQVKDSCWNIYLQMCERKEAQPEIKKWDIEKQLLFIKTTLLELRHITTTAKRRASRAASSVRAESGSIKKVL